MKLFAPHATDFYKTGHPFQNPEGTEIIYANMTARSDRLANMPESFDHKVVVANIQGTMKWMLRDLWNDSFFHQPKAKVLDKYKRRMDSSLGEGVVGTDHFAELHDLGYLPLHIKALPEGSRVNIGVPFLTAQNTHKDFKWMAPWATNYIETAKSSEIWKAVNVATIAYEFRRLFDHYAELTGSSPQFVDIQGHDFSARGVGGIHDAAAHQIGHLYSFKGTDTILSIDYLDDYYDCGSEFIGGSVPATEHSVTCLGGRENELETIRRIITKVYPKGIVSVVSDTWNYWDTLTVILPALKDEILNRQPNELGLAKVTVRPDCYDSDTQIFTSDGWKFFNELNEDSLVAQVTDDETFNFVKPTKLVYEKYSGKMVHFHDFKGKLDLLVTPNHRMVYKQNGRLKIEEASNSKVGHWGRDFLRSVPYGGQGDGSLTPMERLAIAFQADGSYVTGSKSSIRFSFSKKRKIDRLISILEDCNLEFKIYSLSPNPKHPDHSKRVEINVKTNGSHFQKDFNWVSDVVSSSWAREFIEEVSYWDATRRSDSRFKVDSTNGDVVKVIQRVSLFAGYGCKHSVTVDDRKEIFSDVHTLHILKDNRLGGSSIKKKEVDYDGYVGCVQVPSGRVLVRRNGATLVSGNSGDPEKIICGDNDTEPGSREFKGSLQLLWEVFGGTVNERGFKVLNPRVGLIYGDSITLPRARAILEHMRQQGWASENIVFGIGSYTYQYHTRDTFGIAYKTTWGQINGVPIETMKDPVTDRGTKKSAKGLLRVEKEGDDFVLYQQQTREQEQQGALQTVFLNSVIYGEDTNSLPNIRSRLLS
jgi:nicotinic acid phosphoribosyltransferase